jgi:hypothetical protein
VENYEGSEILKTIKGNDSLSFLTDAMLGNLTQSYRLSAMTATSEMNKVINMDKIYSSYPVVFESLPQDSSLSNKASGAYANSTIYINEKSANSVLTVVHETAHHLEEKVLANGISFLNTVEGQSLISEIKKTNSFKNLLESANMPKDILDYYAKDKEVFSRIMEQYFAKKRGGEIERQFLKQRGYLNGKYSKDFYLDDSEFINIEKVIDSLMQKKGLIR